MIKTKRAKAPEEIVRSISKLIRFSKEEIDMIQNLADKHADGNFSAYVRHMALTKKQ